jgi:hypothetical protein
MCTASEIDEGLGRSSTDNAKRQALESQLKFRKNVLKQTHADKKIFILSSKEPNGKYAKHSLDTLTTNVLKLVEAARLRVTTEKNLSDVHLLVGKRVKHTFADEVTYKGKGTFFLNFNWDSKACRFALSVLDLPRPSSISDADCHSP